MVAKSKLLTKTENRETLKGESAPEKTSNTKRSPSLRRILTLRLVTDCHETKTQKRVIASQEPKPTWWNKGRAGP